MQKTFKHSDFTAVFSDENGYFSFNWTGEDPEETYPEFKLLKRAHLCSCKTGKPSKAWANTEFFMKENKIKTLYNYMGCSKELTDQYVVAFKNWKVAERDFIVTEDASKLVTEAAEAVADIQSEIEDFWLDRAQEVYDLVAETESNLIWAFISPYDSEGQFLSDEYQNYLESLTDIDKAIAAAMQADVDVLEVVEDLYSVDVYIAAGVEYRVLTDQEADDAWEDSLDSYLDDCVMPDLSSNMQNYFDRDAWKRDARMDGRGHSLSSYDGCEYDQTPDNCETYYLYREN